MPTNEEIERMDQIMNDIERQLYGAGSNVETTSTINLGAGLMSQISASNSTTWTTLTEDALIEYLNSLENNVWSYTQPDYYTYTIGNNGRVTAYGGMLDLSPSQVNYKNYSIQELKHSKQTKFILTTKSGIKKEKIVLPNKVESERENLFKGRIMGYKQHWENV